MKENLRPMALAFKVAAIIIWPGLSLYVMQTDIREVRATTQPAYRDAPADWVTPAYKRRTYLRIAVIAFLTLLAFIPNRWIVSSKAVAITFISASSFPFFYFVVLLSRNVVDANDALWRMIPLALVFIIFLPLPLSIFLSWLRLKEGERFVYA